MTDKDVVSLALMPDSEYGYHKNQTVSPYWRDRYERDAAKYWDRFYKVNQTNFFKDRHWISHEFQLLQSHDSSTNASLDDGGYFNLLEVGCGVGNTIFPLLESHPQLYIYGLDFSPKAIQFLINNESYQSSSRCKAWVCDIVQEELTSHLSEEMMDAITLIFTLSAISPSHHATVLNKLYKHLKPGGCLLFRDYGVGDLAQWRFENKKEQSQKIDDHFYVRTDGTRSHFFDQTSLASLIDIIGFEVAECKSVEVVLENRKMKTLMPRKWIQGKFIKPMEKSGTSG